jgi:hypothetical protein
MKAIIFARVSTKDQEEGHSLDAQISQALNYAIENDLQIIKQFKIIESSTKGKRPEFKQMIDFIRTQRGKICILESIEDWNQGGITFCNGNMVATLPLSRGFIVRKRPISAEVDELCAIFKEVMSGKGDSTEHVDNIITQTDFELKNRAKFLIYDCFDMWAKIDEIPCDRLYLIGLLQTCTIFQDAIRHLSDKKVDFTDSPIRKIRNRMMHKDGNQCEVVNIPATSYMITHRPSTECEFQISTHDGYQYEGFSITNEFRHFLAVEAYEKLYELKEM